MDNLAGGIVASLVDVVGSSAVIRTAAGVSDTGVDSAISMRTSGDAGADDCINHSRRSMAMGRKISR